MTKKIALEEHFSLKDIATKAGNSHSFYDQAFFAHCESRLPEMGEIRLAEMDRGGIEVSVLSLTVPGAQSDIPTAEANALARRANDFLARHVALHPSRFAGFAHLPMQTAEGAIAELDRCIGEFGFKGALINGRTGNLYLDNPIYEPFWRRVEQLGVPIYLHPGDLLGIPAVMEGTPMTGAIWGWMVETGAHALRLVFSGVFERHPGLTVILGHMGEALPFMLWRFDSRYGIRAAHLRLPRKPSDYIRSNIMITTAGVCAHAPLICSIDAMGADRVLFSVDYPYESTDLATEFIETAPISNEVREQVCYSNAAKLFGL